MRFTGIPAAAAGGMQAGTADTDGARLGGGAKSMDSVMDEAFRDLMPFESWEKIPGESPQAFAAFCAFRDFGPERNIKKAMGAAGVEFRRYDVWRNWCTKHQWFRRAGDYDLHLDRLKRGERAKLLADREAVYRSITERMLAMVGKRIDLMQAGELTQANVMEWLKGSIDIERAILEDGQKADEGAGAPSKQLEIRFSADFDGA